ncbi:MAG: twin-arginine translocation signal domain-containing protein [Bacteroidetes bacterium]|nr:twin-arginine translocation signal domain-containing protein [Bacteroidota bacterium]
MNNGKNTSRRNFLKNSTLGLSAGIAGVSIPAISSANPSTSDNDIGVNKKLPGVVSIASVDLKGLWPETTRELRIKRMLERMEEVAGMKPDLICLPELFDTSWVREAEEGMQLSELAEDEKVPGPVTRRVAAFAKKNNCYVVCPLFTKKDGHFYNSSLLLDRKGNIAGVYHKTHPTGTEIVSGAYYKGGGIVPGAIDQPVIETDFGKVGMQICYDANWADGWDNLKNKGANIVLFSSQFPGGRMLNYYAVKNNYYIISSTGGDARVIDISGNDLDASSEFVRYAWATINLHKVVTRTWEINGRLPDLIKKYGDRLGIKVWATTGFTTIESRDPQLKPLNVLKEFEVPVYADIINSEKELQVKYREGK